MKKSLGTKILSVALATLLVTTMMPLSWLSSAIKTTVRADEESIVNATWDPTGENIAFEQGTATAAVGNLGYAADGKTQLPKSVAIDVTFPGGHTGKKVVVSLAPGVKLVDNGSAKLEENKASTYFEGVTGPTNRTNIYGGSYYNNGDYTYAFGDGLVRASFAIQLQVDEAFYADPDNSVLDDAVKVYLVTNEGVDAQAAIDVNRAQLPAIQSGRTINGNAITDAKITSGPIGAPLTLYSYYGRSISYFYKYAEITYELPAGVSVDDTAVTVGSGTSASTYARANFKVKSVTPNADGTTTVVYYRENFQDSCIGCQPIITIASANYGAGDTIPVKCTKVEALPYGNVETPVVTTSVGTINYNIIADDELMTVNGMNLTATIQSEDNLEADTLLARYSFHNNGAQPSAPKVVTMTFVPKNASNSGYNLPCGVDYVMLTGQINQPVGTVTYTVYDKEQDCILPEARTYTTADKFNGNGIFNLTASKLGLGPNEYLATVSYELDYDNGDGTRYGLKVGGNGVTPVANYQTVGGKIFGKEGLAAMNSYPVMTYTLEDKYEGGSQHSATATCKTTVKTGRNQNENYFTDNTTGTDANKKKVAKAGATPLALSVILGSRQTSNTTNAFFADFDITPTIYIRDVYATSVDETTITNISIVNKKGVDIMQVYKDLIEVTYYLDSTGHVVAKIDTSALAGLTNYDDKYAAAIGWFDRNDPTEQTLKITWSYATAATCTDSTIYNLVDVVFVSSELTSGSSNSASSQTEIADPFGVAQAGDKAVVKGLTSVLGTKFQVVAREDIAITTSGKRADAPDDIDYDKWNGDESDCILIEPGARFVIKNEVFNNSGRVTSTDPNSLNYIYIPVPYMGDDWGALNSGIDANGVHTDAFTYTMTLNSPVDVDAEFEDILTFSYAKVDLAGLGVTSSTNVGTLGGILQDASGIQWDSNSSFDAGNEYNVIRVAISGLPAATTSKIPALCLDVTPTEDAVIDSVNLFQALYYESLITANNDVFQGWATSTQLALQVTKGTISGVVWKDANGDGIMQDNEPKLEGIQVSLTNKSNTQIETTQPVTVSTNADGEFTFGLLPSDQYTVTFEAGPDTAIAFNEYKGSPVDATANDAIDSDATPIYDAEGTLTGGVISKLDIPYYPVGNAADFTHGTEAFGLVPTVTVHYNLVQNDSTPDGAVAPDDEDIVSGSEYTAVPNTQTFDGYKFMGWYTNPGCSVKFVDGTAVSAPAGSTVYNLYGKWVRTSYTVEFNSNEPVGTKASGSMEAQAIDNGVKTKLNANTFDIFGYEFAGWNTAADGSGTAYADEAEVLDLASDGESITLYAQWKLAKYQVEFYVGDTQFITINAVDISTDSITMAPAVSGMLAPAGYSFSKWVCGDKTFEASQKITDVAGFIRDNADGNVVKLYAEFTANEYTIVFNDGAGATSEQKMVYDVEAALDENSFKKEGHTFAGWNTETDGSGTAYSDKEVVKNLATSGTVNLYAQWEANRYTVTFDFNGGSNNAGDTKYIRENVPYNTPFGNPSISFYRPGYKFIGWSTTVNDASTIVGEDYRFTSDTTLYAVWTANEYVIAFNGNGGLGSVDSINAKYDQEYELPANGFTFEGYTFEGWSLDIYATASDAVAPGTKVSNLSEGEEIITFHAIWTANSYEIAYDANGGVGQMDNTPATYNVSVALSANEYVRAGYTFLGWSLDSNATVPTYADGAAVSNLASDDGDVVTLYAVWSANSYVVIFDGNGGSSDDVVPNQSMEYDQEVALNENLYSRVGYDFAGWNTAADGSGDAYADKAVVKNLTTEGAITLYAQWTPHTYVIDYDANGGDGKMAPSEATYDVAVVLKDNEFTRTGYTFVGWALDAAATTPDYLAGDSVTNLATEGSVTLYAVWQANSYTVVFDANCADYDGTMDDMTMVYDQTYTLLLNKFTREGYVFAGWATESDGDVAYADLDDVKNLSAVDGDTVTLYAVWSANEYTVKFDANCEDFEGKMADQPMTFDVEAALDANAFTREGYLFAGWATEADGDVVFADKEVVKNLTSDVDGEVTLYAVWTPITYTIEFNNNGGTGKIDPMAMTYDVAKKLPESGFQRDGYFCVGWSTKDDSNLPEFSFGQPVKNLSSKDGDTVILYPVWIQGAYVTVKTEGDGIAYAEANYLKSGLDTYVIMVPSVGNRIASVTHNGVEVDRSKFTVDGDGNFRYDILNVQGNNEIVVTFENIPTIADCSIVLADGKKDEFMENEDIKITAFGAWEDDTTLLEGDVKYVPVRWHHDDPSGDWAGVDNPTYDYSATFKQAKAGVYIVHVQFDKYVYTKGEWVKADEVELEKGYVVKAIPATPAVPSTGESAVSGSYDALAGLMLIAAGAYVSYSVVSRRRKYEKE
ncbi:MAG: InlB B-repeat-containing protein [Saccharofermentans sp.]|nr:InlB B-repeat-containing protein [Saccharofermentans sp.]